MRVQTRRRPALPPVAHRVSALAVLIAILIAGAPMARAADLSAAGLLYAAGDYRQAARMALEAQTAPGDAFAARALLAAATAQPQGDRQELVALAAEAARMAIARDGTAIEGYLQLAIALGYEGRAIGNIAAHERGLASEARRVIDSALAIDADNPWALTLDGAWHLEIVDAAGRILAIALYGARRGSGLAALRAAAAYPDVSLVILHQCALQLLAHDPEKFGAEAAGWLEAVAAREPIDAFERHTKRQAARLLLAWRSGRDTLLRQEIARQQLLR